jgi:uncharacterized protein YeaO (DUF488 family)
MRRIEKKKLDEENFKKFEKKMMDEMRENYSKSSLEDLRQYTKLSTKHLKKMENIENAIKEELVEYLIKNFGKTGCELGEKINHE